MRLLRVVTWQGARPPRGAGLPDEKGNKGPGGRPSVCVAKGKRSHVIVRALEANRRRQRALAG